MKETLYDILDSIKTHLRFTYETKIYPRKAKHYWCKFYDWRTETEKEGWYVLDENGTMIPWVHFDNGAIMCLYSDMITPIEK
jgi:hypothetical protein